MKLPVRLTTERLTLAPPSVEDAPQIYASYASDAQVTRYLTWPRHRSEDDTREFLSGHLEGLAAGEFESWVIRSGAGLVGIISLRVRNTHCRETGYVLAREAWGRGYMTEALVAILGAAFALPELWRVEATCHVDNLASARVMEKAGMQQEGRLRRHVVHPEMGDEPQDHLLFARVR